MIKVKFEKENPGVTFSQLRSGDTFSIESSLYIKMRNSTLLDCHVGFNALKLSNVSVETAYIDDRQIVIPCDVEISVKRKKKE